MDSNLNGSRRRRRSSLLMSSYYSPTLSSLTTQTATTCNVSISSPHKSKCNVKLREMNNERLRKQNQYKQKKLLRAKLLESKRNIDSENQIEENEHINIASEEEKDQEDLHSESKESIECKTKIHENELSEEKEENDTSEIKMHESEIPAQSVNKQATNGSLKSAIYSSFNSIRSKFRNMINSSNEQTKRIAQQANKSEISRIHKPIINKNLTKILEPTTLIKSKDTQPSLTSHATINHFDKQRYNSSLMHDSFVKVQRGDEQMKRSVSATNVKRCLRKQESSTSCRSMKINEHHGSFGNLANNRPAFKITKIKYDDRHLFSTVNHR
jgi:hypothetical protein